MVYTLCCQPRTTAERACAFFCAYIYMSETTLSALRAVLDHREAEAIRALREENAKLRALRAEAQAACPALLAEVGDYFEHRLDERMQSFDPDLFIYLGRTVASGKAPHETPPGWLMWRHIEGSGIGDSYGAINGGVRDVIGAWPMSDYWVYDDDGQYDKGVFCLPPNMCYCFRPFRDEDSEDDEEESEDEDEDESENKDSVPVAHDRWGFVIDAGVQVKCIMTSEGTMVDDPWADGLRVVEVSSVQCLDDDAAACDRCYSLTTTEGDEFGTEEVMVEDPAVRAAFCEKCSGHFEPNGSVCRFTQQVDVGGDSVSSVCSMCRTAWGKPDTAVVGFYA